MKPVARPKHCENCGAAWPDPKAPWSRTCGSCGAESFKNPLPVVVVIVETIDHEVLLVRRNIPPEKGELALPGGYVNDRELWQQAAARELKEETGIIVAPESMAFLSLKEGGNNIVIFCRVVGAIHPSQVRDVPNEEVQEVVLASGPRELCFTTHTEALREWFSR